jgi:hypothetical protein
MSRNLVRLPFRTAVGFLVSPAFCQWAIRAFAMCRYGRRWTLRAEALAEADEKQRELLREGWVDVTTHGFRRFETRISSPVHYETTGKL